MAMASAVSSNNRQPEEEKNAQEPMWQLVQSPTLPHCKNRQLDCVFLETLSVCVCVLLVFLNMPASHSQKLELPPRPHPPVTVTWFLAHSFPSLVWPTSATGFYCLPLSLEQMSTDLFLPFLFFCYNPSHIQIIHSFTHSLKAIF